MIVLLAVITILYAVVLLFLLYGFHQLPQNDAEVEVPKKAFSIIVPFRDEAKYLPALLKSLAEIDYPPELFEVLLVNDASKDASKKICTTFKGENSQINLQILENSRRSGSPKKDAISTAVQVAAKEFIVTTDADCEVPKEWLKSFNAAINQEKTQFIAGPVRLVRYVGSKRTWLDIFQEMDFFSLQAATIGGFGGDIPFLCNGANLCYKRETFGIVNGFSGNDQIASGDDIFLMEKFQKEGFKTSFLKSKGAVVLTRPQPNLKGLLNQRLRWAAKASATGNTFAKLVGLLVLLMNLGLVVSLVFFLFDALSSEVFFLVFLVKFNVDFSIIYAGAHFFRREIVLKNYLWCSLLYPFFSSYVGMASFFGGFTWKGRYFKK